tara:strand:- start:13329 stop:13610 length:282 start_codon:yes stop_codon:yes gene_type:complete
MTLLSSQLDCVKKEILHIVPEATEVDVKIKNKNGNLATAMVRVLLPKKKRLFAKKQAVEKSLALAKAQDAILKQVKRYKTIRQRCRQHYAEGA